MGTGIVANAAATLPWSFRGLPTAAMVVWLGAALLLILMAVSYLRQRALRLHAGDPVAAQFFAGLNSASKPLWHPAFESAKDTLEKSTEIPYWPRTTISRLVTAAPPTFVPCPSRTR